MALPTSTPFWEFDDTSATTTALDGSGAGRNGTYINSPTQAAPSEVSAACVELNGVDQYIDLPQSFTEMENDEETYNIWIYPTSDTSVSMIWGYFPAGANEDGRGIQLYFYTSRQVGIRWGSTASTTYYYLASNATIPLNQWSMITITASRSTATIKLYVNGAFDSEDTIAGTGVIPWNPKPGAVNPPTAEFYVGADYTYGVGPDNFFEGKIDSFKYFNAVLDASQVTELYNSYVGTIAPDVYWQLEESSGTTAIDSGANNLDGTYVGSPTLFQDGIIKKSVLFDGSSQYIDLPTNGIFETQEFTINVWFKTSTQGVGQTFWVYYPRGAHVDGRGIVFRTSGNVIYAYFGYATGSWDSVVGTATVLLNQWNMATLKVSGGYISLYLNGALDVTKTLANTISWADNVSGNPSTKVSYVGTDADVVQNFFDGYIDEVKYWQSGLTNTQIAELYTSSTSSLTYDQYVDSLSPVVWYKLDETSGTTATEVIASKNGTHVNTPTVGQNSLITSDLTGKSVLYTESSNNYTTLPYISDVLATDMSFSLYFNATALDSAWQTILHIGDNTVGGEQGFTVGLDASNQLSFYWFNGSFRTVAWGEIALSANTTYHLVITVDSTNSEVKAYIDGSLVATKAMPAALILPPSAGGFIGANRSSVELFDGRVDDVSFYSRVLSATEASTLYSKASDTSALTYEETINSLDPLAWYKLDETSGTVAVDSINTNNGTYLNTPILGEAGLVVNSTNAVRVDGTSSTDSIDISNATTVQHSALTFSSTVYVNGVSGTYADFLSFYGSDGSRLIFSTNSEGKFRVYKNGGQIYLSSTSDGLYQQTAHLVVVDDGTKTSVYVNGSLVTDAITTTLTDVTPTKIHVGGFWFSGGLTTRSDVTHDEVLFFTRALSATEVSNLYAAANTVPPAEVIPTSMVIGFNTSNNYVQTIHVKPDGSISLVNLSSTWAG